MTVFFCGIVMSHYTWHNVTDNSRVTTKYVKHFTFFGLGLKLSIVGFSLNSSLLFRYNLCRHAFATLSFISEIFIFLYVGMDALDIEKWKVVGKR